MSRTLLQHYAELYLAIMENSFVMKFEKAKSVAEIVLGGLKI
ncbi:hypothetical protein HanIR_Chr07g0325281 [Helianthus annuus]|nr:hypothetical protein HanIR_Chr07g0325281 [Helianthus annuus]